MQIHFTPNAFTAADIGPVRSNPGGTSGPFAIMPFGPFDFFITEPETAKQLLAAAAEALRILAPDAGPGGRSGRRTARRQRRPARPVHRRHGR